MKVSSDVHLENEVFIYVDESRIIAHFGLVCWQLAGSKEILFKLPLTRNSRRIPEADRTFPRSGPLGGNSGIHV